MSQLQLTNVINVSVSQAGAGAGAYNTSNIALFTHEPYANSFGVLGYNIYLDPSGVATDFGTSSQTYAMALAIFSQQPNILAGGGYLVIIPLIPQVQDLALSAVAASGSFEVTFGGHSSAAINWDDNVTAIQTKVRAVLGLENVVVTGSIASQDLKISMLGLYSAALVTISANSLQTGGSVAITFIITASTAQEPIDAAVTRTAGLVQYFGVIGSLIFGSEDTLETAAVVQALNKIVFFVSITPADVNPGGLLDQLRTGHLSQSRGLYYGDVAATALGMMAAYAGRALSVDFSGSNTTSTMHLKDLIGVQPDPSMTQALLVLCLAAGADTYVSLQGIAKVFCSGTNSFFDQVYNLRWFVGALQIAGFNALAQSSTKLPQTEQGVGILKGAYRQVCEEALTNQYAAPGSWTSATTFGNQTDFIANIAQRGYYIFSGPISQQSQVDRAARKAPLIQIALKEAGAEHSSNVLVNINS